jgi:hypothetical protein
MADVDMNLTVYDYNKNIMKQWPIVEGEGLDNVKQELRNYLENTPAEQYLMMLCREKNDYTLFNFYDTWDDAQFADDVIECFENRGLGIVNSEIIDDGVAMEIWVKQPGQMEEADLYYIFPADSMIIEY